MRFGSRCRAEASGKVTDTDVPSATGSSPDGVERDLGIWLWLAGPTPAFGSRNQLKYEVSGEPNNRYVGLDITIVGMSVTRHSEQPQPEETAACGGRSGRKAVRHDRLGAAGAVRHRRHVRASLASVRNSVFGSAREGTAFLLSGSDGRLPCIALSRELPGGQYAPRTSISSQFVTALLVPAPLARRVTVISLDGPQALPQRLFASGRSRSI